jgi:hypothetical protein
MQNSGNFLNDSDGQKRQSENGNWLKRNCVVSGLKNFLIRNSYFLGWGMVSINRFSKIPMLSKFGVLRFGACSSGKRKINICFWLLDLGILIHAIVMCGHWRVDFMWKTNTPNKNYKHNIRRDISDISRWASPCVETFSEISTCD